MSRMVDVTNVTGGYFRTLGYRLALGRTFEATDDEKSPPVAVINETAARRYFPGTSPLGQRVRLGEGDSLPVVEVVGVTGDVRNRGLDAPVAPEIFIPVQQQRAAWNNQLFVLVQTATDPMSVLPAVREAVRAIDADQPIYSISTVEREMGNALFQRRAATLMILVFATIAMLLAAVGIYGLVSYSVSERVHEIGIRMALGAGAGDVRRMLMRQTLAVVGAGAAVGVAGAIAAGGALRSMVYGVSPSDPGTIAVVVLLLGGIAVLAIAAPTRRATRIHPVLALRED
jgi:putative ABC transport system permease protein